MLQCGVHSTHTTAAVVDALVSRLSSRGVAKSIASIGTKIVASLAGGGFHHSRPRVVDVGVVGRGHVVALPRVREALLLFEAAGSGRGGGGRRQSRRRLRRQQSIRHSQRPDDMIMVTLCQAKVNLLTYAMRPTMTLTSLALVWIIPDSGDHRRRL